MISYTRSEQIAALLLNRQDSGAAVPGFREVLHGVVLPQLRLDMRTAEPDEGEALINLCRR